MKRVKYTELEQQVINMINNEGDRYEDSNGNYYPVLTSEDISEMTNIPMKKLRGVLSSLDQKNVIQEEEFPETMVWALNL